MKTSINSLNSGAGRKTLVLARTAPIINQIQTSVRRLDELLDEFLPEGQEIDFISVDVEGLQHEVLVSNNWNRCRPKIILAETLLSLSECPTVKLLIEKGYSPISKVYDTTFFVRDD